MDKLVSLVETGKSDTSKLIIHVFKGFENIEKALMLMKNNPADLIKPVIIFEYLINAFVHSFNHNISLD